MNHSIRQIVLDTETTGINNIGVPYKNHRIIEIGAIEIINRRFTKNNFHVYIKPNRLIESSAFKIHGINNDFLENKPYFKDIAQDFLRYIDKSELIIHNASFDIGFLDQELRMLNCNIQPISTFCSIIDTLKIARSLFPGKKNTLDSLCLRYKINKCHRTLHSAIIDAHLLGKLYLLMTGGQESMSFLNIKEEEKNNNFNKITRNNCVNLKILKATKEENFIHEDYLKYMKKNTTCLWD